MSPEMKRISISVAALLMTNQSAWSALNDHIAEAATPAREPVVDTGAMADPSDTLTEDDRGKLASLFNADGDSTVKTVNRRPAVLDENGNQLEDFGGLEANTQR